MKKKTHFSKNKHMYVCVSYMWLYWDGFSEGLSRLASSISLKPELPTFLANWEKKTGRRQSLLAGAFTY